MERQEALRKRAEERFETLLASDSKSDRAPLVATVELFICPLFPTTQMIEERELPTLLRETGVQWRGVRFPGHGTAISQHESALLIQTDGGFSLVEATNWGSAFYAYEIEAPSNEHHGIHLPEFAGHLLDFLEHAKRVHERLGYQGTLALQLDMTGVRGQPWVYFRYNTPMRGPASRLDDAVTIRLEVPTDRLVRERDEVGKELLRFALFALNWADLAANDTSIAAVLEQAYKYNFWA